MTTPWEPRVEIWVTLAGTQKRVDPQVWLRQAAFVAGGGAWFLKLRLSCRVAGSQITPVEQTYALTGCMLDPGVWWHCGKSAGIDFGEKTSPGSDSEVQSKYVECSCDRRPC